MKTTSKTVSILMVAGLACGEANSELAPPATGVTKRDLSAQCFFGRTSSGQTLPLSRIVRELVATDLGTVVQVSVVFNREFVDNTYGKNAIGWTGRKGHSFKDLVGSDHVELGFLDSAGAEKLRAKVDYLSTSADWNTGYGNLGVVGGDGKVLVGSASDIVSSGSSMADNLNVFGYVLTTDSPLTDERYSPNREYPDWNFWVEYRVTVKGSAFGAEGFGKVNMQFVHASPSKFEKANTVEVFPDACPSPSSGSAGEPDPGAGEPFPTCLRADPEMDCGTCNAETCGDPARDPDPELPNPLDDPEPTGTTECTTTSNCTEGTFCAEDGHCVGF